MVFHLFNEIERLTTERRRVAMFLVVLCFALLFAFSRLRLLLAPRLLLACFCCAALAVEEEKRNKVQRRSFASSVVPLNFLPLSSPLFSRRLPSYYAKRFWPFKTVNLFFENQFGKRKKRPFSIQRRNKAIKFK
jgi:hypothetical protein